MHYDILIRGNGLETLRMALARCRDDARVLLVDGENREPVCPWEVLQPWTTAAGVAVPSRWREIAATIKAEAFRRYGSLDAALFESRVERCSGEVEFTPDGKIAIRGSEGTRLVTADQVMFAAEPRWEWPVWGTPVSSHVWTVDDLFVQESPPPSLIVMGGAAETRQVAGCLRQAGRTVAELADRNFAGELEDRLLFVRRKNVEVEVGLTDGTTHRGDRIVYCRWGEGREPVSGVRLLPGSATEFDAVDTPPADQGRFVNSSAETVSLKIFRPAEANRAASCAT